MSANKLNAGAPLFKPRQLNMEDSEVQDHSYPETESSESSQPVNISDNGFMNSYVPPQTMSDFIAQFGNLNTSISYDVSPYMYIQPVPVTSLTNSNYPAFNYNANSFINDRMSSANKSIMSNTATGNSYMPIIQYPRVSPTMIQLPLMIPNTVPNIISPANRSRRNSCLKDKVFNTGDHQIDKHLTELYKRINPRSEFSLDVNKSRFFVIKSYTEDHVHRSIKYGEWCSTQRGNDILDTAYGSARNQGGHVYLFFSVNGSGYFCGVAEMTSHFDTNNRSAHWNDDKWLGGFSVDWLYVKDVPNKYLKHIILEYNDNRPITNSRDATEIKPSTKGNETLRIIHEYHHNSSLFDDFDFYENREKECNATASIQSLH